MQRIWEEIKESALPVLIIFSAVALFGKIVEHNTDVDKNWQDYIDSLKRK